MLGRVKDENRAKRILSLTSVFGVRSFQFHKNSGDKVVDISRYTNCMKRHTPSWRDRDDSGIHAKLHNLRF